MLARSQIFHEPVVERRFFRQAIPSQRIPYSTLVP